MKEIFALFTLSALIGMSIAIGYFYFYIAKKVLFDLLEIFTILYEFIVGKISALVNILITYIKSREFRKWKKEKLPELKTKTRYGDTAATAERIARSNHKGRYSGQDKKYEY